MRRRQKFTQNGHKLHQCWRENGCRWRHLSFIELNPVGKYNLILVLTDTVGQHSVSDPSSGYVTVANFEMRELTAEEKAAAEKVVAEKAAATKAVADKIAADKAAAAKALADQAIKDLTDLMNLKSQVTSLQTRLVTLQSKLKKICSAKPKPKGC